MKCPRLCALPLVICAHALRGCDERRAPWFRQHRERTLASVTSNFEVARLAHFQLVETPRALHQRYIAAHLHIRNDASHDLVNGWVLRRLEDKKLIEQR